MVKPIIAKNSVCLNGFRLSFGYLALILILTPLICSCGLSGIKVSESDYKKNLENYLVDEVVAYLCFKNCSKNDINKDSYNLYYDLALKVISSNGYKVRRLSEDELTKIGINKSPKFKNYPFTEFPSSFEDSNSAIDELFKNYRTIMFVEFVGSYSTGGLDNCKIMYALLDSKSKKVIVSGPAQTLKKPTLVNDPHLSYQRNRTDDQRSVKRFVHESVPGVYSETKIYTDIVFSGYKITADKFIKLVIIDSMKMTPMIRNN